MMLEELKEQYRNSLPEKVRTIKVLLQDFRDGNSGAIDGMRLLAHSLHGSGSTFGYPQISAAAKKVEHASTDDLLPQLTLLIKVLLEVAAIAPSASRHILIIEDDADISNLLKVLVGQKSPSYRVLVAASAGEARELLAKHSFALVVLDLVLPDSDGRILLRQIRAAVPAEVPVFVLSGIAQESIRDECLVIGAKRYYTKPFIPETIAAAIDAELSGSRSSSEIKAPAGNAASASSKPAAPSGDTVQRILVAEDDELLASIIKHRLSREGHAVEHVNNGEAAMAAVQKNRYALIILDVKMPVSDGFEVLTRIRSELMLTTPVIMLTAMGSEKDVVRGYDLGASDYIVKPFSPVELLARVKSLLKTG